jgi:hypothetical protein
MVLAITSIAWLTSLSVIATVPLDIYSTMASVYLPALAILWSISYWSTQVLTWAVIPILQNYVVDGGFTVWTRLASAIKKLWRFYLIIGALCAAGIVWALLIGQLQLPTLPALVFTLSNTYGLICIIGLLGFGLVEVPRILWRRSWPETRLKWHYHRVGRAAEALAGAKKELEKTLAIVVITSQQIPRGDVHLRSRADMLMKYADSTSPMSLRSLAASEVDLEQLDESDLDYATDEKGLAKLRERYKLAAANFVGCRAEYLGFITRAIDLEAVTKSRALGVYAHPLDDRNKLLWTIMWYYTCQLRPWVLKIGSILAACASVVVLWCEATIGTGRSPDLSPLSLAVQDSFASLQGTTFGSFLQQLVIACPLGYMVWCTFFSLFKLGALQRTVYHMVPGATWGYSLLLNGSLLARFAAPLCFNFLHVIRMNEYLSAQGKNPVFVTKMGVMTDVPLLGSPFNTWFPLIMVAYTVLLALGLWEKCASIFVPKKFKFDQETADDEHSALGVRLVREEGDALARGRGLGAAVGLLPLRSNNSSNNNANGNANDNGIVSASEQIINGSSSSSSKSYAPISSSTLEMSNLTGVPKNNSSNSRARLVVGADSSSGDPDRSDRVDDLFAAVGTGRHSSKSGGGGRRR